MKKYEIVKTYQQRISKDRIVSDGKVYREGVERKKRMLDAGEDIGKILVIKHPVDDIFAVMNGHHAFEARKERGADEMDCSVIQDYIGPLFYMTKKGMLQPGPHFTEYIRVPFNEMKDYIKEFLENPEKLKVH